MAHVEPFRALHYDLARVGGLDPVVAPPYDVIDAEQRTGLAARSPYNVVELDLPQGDDPYRHAAALLERWRSEGIVVQDPEPAVWALEQAYTGPDGRERTRRGILARVRIEPYGPGGVRPHERTHPGPMEDRLRLTRATRANLSPIFMLHDDPEERVAAAVASHLEQAPAGEHTDADGTRSRLWRIGDDDAHAAIRDALAPAELLIADGHHRYETARVYAEEIGGEGPHSYVLACLVALQDPGLTVFPTHRLLTGLDDAKRTALRELLLEAFEVHETDLDGLVPAPDGRVRMGYLDAFHRRPLALALRDAETVAAVLPDRSAAYRALDTAVLEALVLDRALGMSEDDIAHLAGLEYARSDDEARERVLSGDVQAAFFMAPTPVSQVRDVAAAGETMPPKSTYFFPKVPTGLVFHALA